MSNPKINGINVGGVDYDINTPPITADDIIYGNNTVKTVLDLHDNIVNKIGSSSSAFATTTIELALKNLIDSFNSDGTYTGRFEATTTPNKWFNYQIDLFDNVASGYIVNTVDPDESYTICYKIKTHTQATLSSIGGVVIGSITAYAGSTAPNGYLICDGSAISRTDYAKLFEVIGTTYGSGDGSTTFNIPDCRESALVGIGTRGSGVATHDTYTLGEFKDDQLQSHTHSYNYPRSDSFNGGQYSYNAITYSNSVSTGSNTGRSGSVTRGKRLGMNYIIKY